MEKITYRDQVIWGTSLHMAEEDEIELCYKYIKDSIDKRRDIYSKCNEAISIVSFINSVDPKWRCGNSVKSFELCDKVPSIEKVDLINLIDGMVSDDINIDYEEIFKVFIDLGHIVIYKCDRVFFMKNA